MLATLTTIPIEGANTVHRVFHALDGTTYLVLAFTFAGGSRDLFARVFGLQNVSSSAKLFFPPAALRRINYESIICQLKRKPPNTKLLILPSTTDPLDLFQLHLNAAKETAVETASAPLRHEPIDRLSRRQEDIAKEDRRVYLERPYSWRDHIRWYLQLDARPSTDGK